METGREHRALRLRGLREAVAVWTLAATTLLCGCARPPTPAVAPFGGRLAQTLPYLDVLGFLRVRPADPAVSAWLDRTVELPKALRETLAGPALFVLEAARHADLIAPDQSLALLFLDPSVHGAFLGFAWRGGGEKFRSIARAAGLAMDGESIALPGRGRIEDFATLVFDTMGSMRRDDDKADVAAPTVRYHLVERDGLSLLLPARDGAAHVAATLATTGLLDAETGPEACLRFELGAAVSEAKQDLQQWVGNMVSSMVLNQSFAQDLIQREGEQRWDVYSDLQMAAWNATQVVLDAAVSVEHLFLLQRGPRFDLFLRSEAGRLLDSVSGLWRERPVAELLAGAPSDVPILLAASVEPEVVGELPDRWERDFDARARRRMRRAQREAARAAALPTVESDDAPFLDSFGGRFWVAVGPPPADAVEEKSLLERMGLGPAREPAGEAPSPPSGEESGAMVARVWGELRDDRSSEALLAATLDGLFSEATMQYLRMGALAFYSVQRGGGGCVEAVGAKASAVVRSEWKRLEAPAENWHALPADVPEKACALMRFAGAAAGEARWVAMQRASGGLQLTWWNSER